VEVQPATPDYDEDDSLLTGISTDALIDALKAAMIFQDEAEQSQTKILINALVVSKIFA
jgi:hypothetical protein